MEDYIESCEMIAILIENLNFTYIAVCRPPDTKLTVFTTMMKKVAKMSEMEIPVPTVIITGDFNLYFIEWDRNEMKTCI